MTALRFHFVPHTSSFSLAARQSRALTLAADSVADPNLSAASAPALQAILETLGAMEARLRDLDQQIETLAGQSIDPETKALAESIPGFGPTVTAKVLAYLPVEILHCGSNRKVAARLQAFMGNDPRLQESGQWKGQTRMSKRGVEPLRTRPSSRPPSAPLNTTRAKGLLPAQTGRR
jgi:transposase